MFHVSVMTFVEFHSVSVEIQYVFISERTPLKDFLTSCKATCLRANKNRAYFYLVEFDEHE